MQKTRGWEQKESRKDSSGLAKNRFCHISSNSESDFPCDSQQKGYEHDLQSAVPSHLQPQPSDTVWLLGKICATVSAATVAIYNLGRENIFLRVALSLRKPNVYHADGPCLVILLVVLVQFIYFDHSWIPAASFSPVSLERISTYACFYCRRTILHGETCESCSSLKTTCKPSSLCICN